jgi:hypothetical protein
VTLADFKRTAGIEPDGWTHERVVDGLRQVYVPGEVSRGSGWWWAIIGAGDDVLTFGWALGTVRDRNIDLAHAMVRCQARFAS